MESFLEQLPLYGGGGGALLSLLPRTPTRLTWIAANYIFTTSLRKSESTFSFVSTCKYRQVLCALSYVFVVCKYMDFGNEWGLLLKVILGTILVRVFNLLKNEK